MEDIQNSPAPRQEGEPQYENPVFNSTRFVVDHADFVTIDRGIIKEYSDGFQVPEHTNWMRDSFDLSGLSETECAMLSTVFNSISFSYWGEPYWSVEHKGVSYDRASWSLVAAILRSREEGNSLLDPKVLSSLDKDALAFALRGNTEIPMLEERFNILNNVGKNILEKGGGSVLNLVQESDNDALKLVNLIQVDFAPAFDDRYEYKGQTVQFNKRAQALVESLHSIFDGQGYGSFKNVNQLSALADYIIPNLLRGAGILTYADELAQHIDAGQEIEKGSAYEVELRASVVWAIEWMRQELSKRGGVEIQTAAINDGLWLKGGEVKTPFHKVRTTAY